MCRVVILRVCSLRVGFIFIFIFIILFLFVFRYLVSWLISGGIPLDCLSVNQPGIFFPSLARENRLQSSLFTLSLSLFAQAMMTTKGLPASGVEGMSRSSRRVGEDCQGRLVSNRFF